MNVWFTSDAHFFHENIIKYCNRPFASVSDMNEVLVRNWNNVVGKNDTVYSLGDMFFCGIDSIESILGELNGNIHYITGNHCKTVINQSSRLLQKGLLKEIVPSKEISWHKQKISMYHYAGRTWNGSHYGSWMLFGHTHGTMESLGKSVDVGVDSPFILGEPAYRPFSFDEIKAYMQLQEIHDNFG